MEKYVIHLYKSLFNYLNFKLNYSNSEKDAFRNIYSYVPDMKLQTTNISVQSSARTNTVCGDHFNEVVSLQTHTFPIKKDGKGKGKSI
jgi:hypothetical protein